PELVDYVRSIDADHLLITGDLTTTALPAEFRAARAALAGLLHEPDRVTIVPGNHDRYTLRAHRSRRFEEYLGAYSPGQPYPWLRMSVSEPGILGLAPTRAGVSARGKLPGSQLLRAAELVAGASGLASLVIACHYPVATPPEHAHDYARKPLVNAGEIRQWLRTIGPHLFCCGHVHAAWAHQPDSIPNQLCLNPGAPLLRDRSAGRLPGFLEIALERSDVTVRHHVWTGESWQVRPFHEARAFFPRRRGPDAQDRDGRLVQ